MAMSQLSPQSGRGRSPHLAARRQQRREALHHRLVEYLDAVAVAVRALGFTVADIHVGPGPDLDAVIIVGPGPDPTRDGGHPAVPEQVQLAWSEDVGWSVTFPGPDTDTAFDADTAEGVVRYLHLDLAPPPDAVAGFLAAVPLDGDDVGMPYPAAFRLRSQTPATGAHALASHSPTASATPSTTAPTTAPTTTVLRAAPPPSPGYAAAV